MKRIKAHGGGRPGFQSQHLMQLPPGEQAARDAIAKTKSMICCLLPTAV